MDNKPLPPHSPLQALEPAWQVIPPAVPNINDWPAADLAEYEAWLDEMDAAHLADARFRQGWHHAL